MIGCCGSPEGVTCTVLPEAMNDATQRISRYLLPQLVVNISCGLPIGIGLTLIGIPNAALWGILVVLLRFIPYLGIVIEAAFPLALAIAVASDWMLFVWTALLFVRIELVVANLLELLVYSGTTGLSSVALIAAATFLDLALGADRASAFDPDNRVSGGPRPTRAAATIPERDARQRTSADAGADVYQRILANDPEEATNKPKSSRRTPF